MALFVPSLPAKTQIEYIFNHPAILRWITSGSSRYSSAVVYICLNVLSDAKMEPPIQVE